MAAPYCRRVKMMFLDLDKKEKEKIQAIDDRGGKITCGEILDYAEEYKSLINERSLVFIMSENTIGVLANYVASLSGRIVPLLISCDLDREMLNNLIDIYTPSYLITPERFQSEFSYRCVKNKYSCSILETNFASYEINPELALLLTTSGSTGSPKLVRHSYKNLEESAKNVSAFFAISPKDSAIASLPIQYTMGLSVINSHIYAGATVLLTTSSLTEKVFWDFIKKNRASSFTGVPYSYEILDKIRFFRMDLPDIALLSQGGGKLSEELFKKLADYAERTGKKFIATYGQTEGTARMAYLPPELAVKKTCSIGFAIPNGNLSLIDENGKEITEMEAVGEMLYRGGNVTMGYSLCKDDLMKGDERKGVLPTGDIARRDKDGCYYIIGRKNRFLKIYGLRVSLDEIEQLVKSNFDTDCICSGKDDLIEIFVTNQLITDLVQRYISEKTGIFSQAIKVSHTERVYKNEVGKTIYN